LGNIGVDVRAILKLILETQGVRYEFGVIGSIRSNNPRRHGNEPSGSINTRIFTLSQNRLGLTIKFSRNTVTNGSKEEMKRHVHYEAPKDRNGDGVRFQG
jgi:hypothetical protein